jgi:hypothetical protein
MRSRQRADAGSYYHDPKHWTSGGSLGLQIDKANLLCYKHSVLAIERLERRCECL